MKIPIALAILCLATGCLGKVVSEPDNLTFRPPSAPFEHEIWCVDHQDTSRCARDTNDGASCSCTGGHGPLLTEAALWARWGSLGTLTFAPDGADRRVSVLFASDDVDEQIDQEWTVNTDAAGHSVQITLQCLPGEIVGASTLTRVVAKNIRGVPPSNNVAAGLYRAAVPGVTLDQHMRVTGPGGSVYWPYYDLTRGAMGPPYAEGDTWAFTQPYAPNDPRVTWPPPQDTISEGDAVTVDRPVQIAINRLVAYVELDAYDRPSPSNVLVRDCAPSLLAVEANATINTNNGVSWNGDLFQEDVQSVPGSNGIAAYVNDFAPYVAVDVSNPTAGFSGMQNQIIGGGYAEQGAQGGRAQWTITCSGCVLDGDIVFGGQVPGIDSGSLTSLAGDIYVDANESILIYSGATLGFVHGWYDKPHAWGAGGVGVLTGGHLTYPSGEGLAASTFLEYGLLLWTGGTTTTNFCIDGNCSYRLTPTVLDEMLGATTRCADAESGGADICN